MGQMVTTRSTKPTVKAGAANDSPQQYLTFSLGGEVFALGILNVKEIIEFGNITEIPMTPEFIRGVINLRGAVVPVIDLSARFGRKSTTVSRRTCIIIVEIESEGGRHELGVVVDGRGRGQRGARDLAQRDRTAAKLWRTQWARSTVVLSSF